MREIYRPSSELDIETKRRVLVDYFEKHAEVQNLEKGYIYAPWVNLEIDPVLQGIAADLVASHFKDKRIDIVSGIPQYGVPFSAAIAERIETVKLITSRKGLIYPPIFGNEVIVTDTSVSFTTGEKGFSFVFPSIIRQRVAEGKNHLLLVDDFCAKGDSARAIIPSLQILGIEVSYAVYVAKIFQGGLGKIRQLGVDAYAVINIEALTPDKKIITRK